MNSVVTMSTYVCEGHDELRMRQQHHFRSDPCVLNDLAGLLDHATKVLHDWQAFPVVGKLAAGTVTNLLAGATQQAGLAVDSWNDSQHSVADSTKITQHSTIDEDTSNTATQSVLAGTAENDCMSTSHRQATTVVSVPAARVLRHASHVLQQMVTAGQGVLSRATKGPLAKLLWPDQCVVKKTLSELSAFQLPNQTNRLALMFDPLDNEVPFTFGVEIFEKGHKTNPHTHAVSHELFFILAGSGIGFCDDEQFPLTTGDLVVFPPTSVHGIDNGKDSKMYCLELMLPNDMFAEFVRQGQPVGKLRDNDMCVMIAQGCASS